MLGNGRLEAMCFDGVKRLCHIRGKLRKKVDFGKQASFLFLQSSQIKPNKQCFHVFWNEPVITSRQVWINQSDIVLIGLRDYQVNQN